MYRTSLDSVGVSPEGWVMLPNAGRVAMTMRPLLAIGNGTPFYARLTYRDARAAAQRLGGRLPTRGEVVAAIAYARSQGHVLSPVTLSYGPEMMSLAHAREHDARVAVQLTRASYSRPREAEPMVAGIGKHWVLGAAPGAARICGWPRADGSLIQQGIADNHNELHHDYATTTLVVRDVGVPAGEWLSGLHVYEPKAVRARILSAAAGYLGIAEHIGAASHPTIQRMLGAARRGGAPTAGMPGDVSGAPTLGPRPSDEIDWCAAAATTCVAEGLDGAPAPCGRRAACWEVVADAMALGTWRDVSSGYVPQHGDLEVTRRAGGDPRRRGELGHIGIRLNHQRIDGNSANSMRLVMAGLDVVGWVQVAA